MPRPQLRTQLLVATLLIIGALLGSLLVVVRLIVRSEIAESVRQSTDASLHAFEIVQRDRELQLSRTAAMLAELPTLKAVLATQHALTIQDASDPFWKLAGSQLFVVSSPDGQVFGFHVSNPGWDASLAETDLRKSLEQGEESAWWYGNGRLYRVFLHNVFAGSDKNQRQVGILAVGYQIDSDVAAQLSLASGSQIALATGNKIIASTLPPQEENELQGRLRLDSDTAIVCLPAEIFVEFGLAIKQASPFHQTIVISICNDRPNYIPTRRAFSEGSYEVTNSRLMPGCGEAMGETAVRLLSELKH